MTKANKVLFITQEITPYVSESEMANIGRNLPQAIQEKGREIRTFMPKWGNINERRNQLHEVIRLSGMNLDLHGQHIGNGDGAAGGFEGVAGFLRVADDEAQDAELGGIGYGNSADVDMVLAENIGDVRHAALFVFDKDRDLFNLHRDHSLMLGYNSA